MSASDPDELARKTLELWQDQLAALAGDPEAGAAMAKLMAMALVGPAAAMRAFAEAIGGSLNPDGATGGHRGRRPETGPSAVAAAPESGGDRLSGLEHRLAELELRVADLEGSAGRARGGARGGSRKPRSRPPR